MAIPKNNLAKSTLAVITYIAQEEAAKVKGGGSNAPSGCISIEDIGCVPNDNSVDNADIINKKLASTFGNIFLFVPPGQWYAASCINSINKTINLIGAGSTQTQWRISGGGSAYFIMREKFTDDKGMFLIMDAVTIKGIDFQCTELPKGVIPKPLDLAGLKIYHICNIDDVAIVGFTGGGLQMYGQLNGGNHLNCSGSLIQNVRIANIKGDAVMIVGPDANACTFRSLDIRDCTGIAFNDRSFLGNLVQGVMTHACERSFYVENGYTAHTSFIGCYHEAGQKLPAANYGGQVKELPYFEGMFSWDLGARQIQ